MVPPVITKLLLGKIASETIRIPDQLVYLLPDGFTSQFVNGFASGTTTPDQDVNELLARAAAATFVAYDDDFAEVVGPNATAVEVANIPGSGAFEEGGIYVPSQNEVWFTSSFMRYPSPGFTTAYKLDTGDLRNIAQISYGAGGYILNGIVYTGGLSPHPGIQATNPSTLETHTVLNSYMGMPFTLADDLVWSTDPTTSRPYCFFTTFYTALFPGVQPPSAPQPYTMPNGVWRWDPHEKVLLPAISRIDIPIPNGVRVSPDQKTLYVTDSLSTKSGGAALGNHGFAPTAAPYIWAFDLNESYMPTNKRLLGISRTGYPDGIHVDDAGRIWTAEGDGVVVRAPGGKVLGIFNALAFGMDPTGNHQIANFAIARDVLYVGAGDSLFAVALQEVIAIESR